MADPAFAPAIAMKAGILEYRVATFSVVPCGVGTPFFENDCYLVLSVQADGPKHIWMWIGAESSVDERGTLAIKAVELDNALGGAAHQHRVEQGSEDAAFLALFKETGGLRVHAGGYASGFAHVSHFWETPLERLPQLLVRFCTRARRPRTKFTHLNRNQTEAARGRRLVARSRHRLRARARRVSVRHGRRGAGHGRHGFFVDGQGLGLRAVPAGL